MVDRLSELARRAPGMVARVSPPAALFLASLLSSPREGQARLVDDVISNPVPGNNLIVDRGMPSMEQALGKLGLTLATPEPTRTPTLLPTARRVAALDTTIGGGGFELTTGNPPTLSWRNGSGQQAYYLWTIGLNSGRQDIIPQGGLRASATSFNEAQILESTCYALLIAMGPSGPFNNSDLVCDFINTRSPNFSEGFKIRSNESSIFTLSWNPQANTDYLIVDVVKGRNIPVSGVGSLDYDSGGSVSCVVLGKIQSGIWVGNSDLACMLSIANFSNQGPELTATPSITPSRTPSLTPTILITPTVTRSPTPTAFLGPVTFNWDIGPGVPTADVQRIQAGITWSRTEFQNYYGVDILRPVNSPIIVKIVADGTGDGCCSAFDVASGDIGPRPRFDVKHTLWLNMNDLDKEIAAAHELTHVWHSTLGCLTLPVHPLPDWLEEGTAAYIPHKSLSRRGILNDHVTRWIHFAAAEDSGQLSVSLQTLEHPAPFYPGHVGYVAVDHLISMAPTGHMSLRNICEAVGLDKTKFDQEFQRIFGISKSEFYSQFPSYLQSLRTSPIYLELIGRLQSGSTQTRVEYEFNFAAYGYEKLTSNQQFAAWILPPEMCGWGQEQLGRVTIALCNASPNTYPIGLQLPDGRRAQVNINHTSLSSASSTITPTRVSI